MSSTPQSSDSLVSSDAASIAQSDTASTAQSDAASTAQSDAASTAQSDAASIAQSDATSTAQSDATSLVQADAAALPAKRPTRFGMLTRFSLFVRTFFLWIYSRVVHEPSQVQEVLSVPKGEPIVYLLASENKHDYLFLSDLCRRTGMPLAYTGNGGSKLRYSTLWRRFAGLFSKRKKKPTPVDIATAVYERQPILLFLNQYGMHERENRMRTEEIFERIRDLVLDTPGLRIHFFTVGVIWERRAESYNHSLINEIYGTPTRPSSIRRFLAILPDLRQLFFQIGQPLCLIHHHEIDASNVPDALQLKQMLNDDIDMMHTQVNGPKVKPHQQLLREIVTSDPFQQELRTISQATGKSQEELVHEASRILDKTASKFSLVVCKMFCTVMTPMWSLIYNGLYYDTEKINEIRELSKTHRLVFIPSHKSHIDYLVLSILLFQNGVLPPHIAAGDNLNFFPIGSILRRGGAFFIKRSFRGELLYSACIRHYISKILHEGYPIEFFIEGGRSRIGQVLQPKFGILRMVAQAVTADPSLPVKIIPCAITYEKVIEDMGYKNEQDGGAKKKESISNLVRTTRLLISKYGQIYVSFADPIDLNEALHIPEDGHLSDDDLTRNIDSMAVELMDRINRASTITTSSLLSCALLNAPVQPITIDHLLQNAAFFLSLLIEHGALFSPVLQTALAAGRASIHASELSDEVPSIPPMDAALHLNISALVEPLRKPVLETVKLFQKNKAIRMRSENTLEIDDDSRLQMSFYKNILLFPLIEDIYLSCAVLSIDSERRTLDAVRERFSQIARLLSIEFSPERCVDRFDTAMSFFEGWGWVSRDADLVVIHGEAARAMRNLMRCIFPHIECYGFVFADFAQWDSATATDEADVLQCLLGQAQALVRAHRMLAESRSKVYFSHALQKLQAMKCIEVSYEQKGKKHAKFLRRSAEIPAEITALFQDLIAQKANW